MKPVAIALTTVLAVSGLLSVSAVHGQQNANSVRVLPGRHKVVHATHVYRRPSTNSDRVRHLPRGSSVWVIRDAGPWLVIRFGHHQQTGFLRKHAVLDAHTMKRVAAKFKQRTTRAPRDSLRYGREGRASAPVVEFLSPRNGTKLRQQQPRVLIRGRVTPPAFRNPDLDVFFVLDVSGSTRKYAGLNFLKGLSATEQQRSFISDTRHYSETDNSILGGAVGATRRLISQLDPKTTRVGLITVRGKAELLEPLTDDFGWLHLQLKEVLRAGPSGGTHLADGLRLGIRELAGLGESKTRRHATKIQMLLTDGYPTLPTGGGRGATPADIDVAVKSAGIAQKAGVKVHVFGLGQGASGRPLAAVQIATATGGTYTAVTQPDDIFNVLEESSTVGVTHLEITNETMAEPPASVTLGADGHFSSVVPVQLGRNRIKARAYTTTGNGSVAYLSVDFEMTEQRSLELEVFLEQNRRRVLQQLTR